MSAPQRPALRYLGGKWRLAPWIIGHFPPHRVYVEPFGGAASVLLRKPRAYAEIYNDLDGSVVSFFEVLRDPNMARRLVDAVRMTPFARSEFNGAYVPSDDPVEAARRLLVRSYMGHGSNGTHPGQRTGFRANSNRSGTTPAHDWANLPPHMSAITERLMGVVIENRPAQSLIARFDGPDTLFYVDPPYLHSTRSGRRHGTDLHCCYRHELTDADHADLLAALETVAGAVILSGYPHPLYEHALTGWKRVERPAHADGARSRTEVLWLNPAASAGLKEALSGVAA